MTNDLSKIKTFIDRVTRIMPDPSNIQKYLEVDDGNDPFGDPFGKNEKIIFTQSFNGIETQITLKMDVERFLNAFLDYLKNVGKEKSLQFALNATKDATPEQIVAYVIIFLVRMEHEYD